MATHSAKAAESLDPCRGLHLPNMSKPALRHVLRFATAHTLADKKIAKLEAANAKNSRVGLLFHLLCFA